MMGPEGLDPSLFVYVVVPTFPTVHADLPVQKEKVSALDARKKEMETTATELRILGVLRFKLPPATKHLVEPHERVLVYREKTKQYEGPFTVTKVCDEEVYMKEKGVHEYFIISQIVPEPKQYDDLALKRLFSCLEQLKSELPPCCTVWLCRGKVR